MIYFFVWNSVISVSSFHLKMLLLYCQRNSIQNCWLTVRQCLQISTGNALNNMQFPSSVLRSWLGSLAVSNTAANKAVVVLTHELNLPFKKRFYLDMGKIIPTIFLKLICIWNNTFYSMLWYYRLNMGINLMYEPKIWFLLLIFFVDFLLFCFCFVLFFTLFTSNCFQLYVHILITVDSIKQLYKQNKNILCCEVVLRLM